MQDSAPNQLMVGGEFLQIKKTYFWGFPGGSVVKNPPANAGNMNLIPGPGRSPMLGNNSAHAPRTCDPQVRSLQQAHTLQ